MNKLIKLGYDDISIVPETISKIRHRKECFCYDENLSLPIFTAPMDQVVDIDSAEIYMRNSINAVIPRTVDFENRIKLMLQNTDNERCFFAFSLTEAQELFLEIPALNTPFVLIDQLRFNLASELFTGAYRICIDIANGHMKELLDVIKEIKKLYGQRVIIMSGNIANPKTYRKYVEVGCDFVRCSIGSGSRCTTSSNVAIHYGCFSLLKEIWEIKNDMNAKCKIIADGGIKGYGDIQKALLYADYVMIGSLFNKAIDSAGTPVYGRFYWHFFGEKILNPFKTFLYYGKKVKKKDYGRVLRLIKEGKVDVWKEYYGMSTKIAQSKINPNGVLKTGEGKVERQKVEYSIKQWVQNESDFLRSAMSYTNSKTLEEYKDSNWIQLVYKSYNK
jgi:IMP dehydrogenase/GMP reductase